MNRFGMIVLVGLAAAMASVSGVRAGDDKARDAKKIKLLVVSGGHPFVENAFREVFSGYQDMECTFVDEKVGGEAFDDISHFPYDAIVLYNFDKNPSEKRRENFLKLLDKGVGLVILHHAIYGYRPWPEFQKMVGVTCWLSGAKDDVHFKVHVEDPKHPITQGLSGFDINDEVYAGHKLDPKVHVILTTDEPSNMKAIAWTHTYRKSPVCYFQLGHGPNAYACKGFAAVLGQSIRWTAGRLSAEK